MNNSRPSIVTGTFSTMDAIQSLVVDAEFYITTDPEDIETITWVKPTVAPVTSAEIDAEKARLLTEWTAQEYARNRQAEYPSLLELTVALYDTDDKSAVEAKRAEVKAKFPKPS
jgi:hypothetical protein